MPESINWLFNMRGRDVPNVPVVLCFALVPQEGHADALLRQGQDHPRAAPGLEGLAKVADVATMVAALRKLGAGDKRVMIDPATVPLAIANAIKGVSEATLIERRDPMLLRQGEQERRRARRHARGAPARRRGAGKVPPLVRRRGAQGQARRDRHRRRARELPPRGRRTCVDVSFDTISGAGPNGAIVHYRVEPSRPTAC